jgi:hypothetical protein
MAAQHMMIDLTSEPFILQLSKIMDTSDVKIEDISDSLMSNMSIRTQLLLINSGMLTDSITVTYNAILDSDIVNLIYYTSLFGNPSNISIMPHPLMQIQYHDDHCILTPLALHKISTNDPSFDIDSSRFKICNLLHQMWKHEYNSPPFNSHSHIVPYALFYNSNNRRIPTYELDVNFLDLQINPFCNKTDLFQSITNSINNPIECYNLLETLAIGYHIAPLSLITEYSSSLSIDKYVEYIINPLHNIDRTYTRSIGFLQPLTFPIRKSTDDIMEFSMYNFEDDDFSIVDRNTEIINRHATYVESDENYTDILLRGQWLFNRAIYTLIRLRADGTTGVIDVESDNLTEAEFITDLYEPSAEVEYMLSE